MVRIFEILTKSPFFRQRKKLIFFSKLEAKKNCSKNRKLTKISETYPNMSFQLQVFAEIHRFYEIEEKRFFSSICEPAGHGAFKVQKASFQKGLKKTRKK